MSKKSFLILSVLATCLAAVFFLAAPRAMAEKAFPDPVMDEPRAASPALEKIVFSGGCFWGVEGVFEHVKGVKHAVSGYAGGTAETAQYETVSTGTTGHAESVEVTYDPSQVTLGALLKVFFSVAHDPTELNRQGPDTGTQYRSAVFFETPDQEKVVKAYIAQLQAAGVFEAPIVTEVNALKDFYSAESYHQDFMRHNPDYPYIVVNDAPKVARLKERYPDLYRE